jgi:hypothetical protein
MVLVERAQPVKEIMAEREVLVEAIIMAAAAAVTVVMELLQVVLLPVMEAQEVHVLLMV